MKNYLLIALASLFAFASCSKESVPGAEETKEKVSVLSFTSERPQIISDTKTAWDGSTIVWSTGDKIRVGYTIDGNWMGKEAAAPTAAKFYASNAVSIDSSNPNIGTFDVPVGDNGFVDPGTSGAYMFYGIYPYKAIEATASAAPSLTVSLPSTQTPASSSFDAAGDIMVGKTAVMGGFPSTPVEISWSRIVAHLDLTFKNLSSVSGYTEGETVSSIKLTTNSEAPIAGSFTLDITNNNISGASSNEILISGENLSISGGNIEAWCCVLPVTITSLDVEIVTNKAKYTRSITGISKTFKQNARNKLAVNMQSAVRDNDFNRYVLVNDTDELTNNSEVIIVAKGYDFALSSTQNPNNRGQVSITKATENGITFIDNPAATIQRFTLVAGTTAGSTIAFKCINGDQANKYIYAAANNKNLLKSQDNLDANASFSVAFDNGSATLISQGSYSRNWIRYNNSESCFSCYETGQNDVSIYKLTGSGTAGEYLINPTPHVKVTSSNPMSIDNTSGNETITYTVVNPVAGGTVSASTTVSWISNLDCSTSGQVSFDFEANNGAKRDGKIVLSYNGNETEVIVEQAASDNIGYDYTYTSNVTVSAGSNSEAVTLIIDGISYSGVKAGSSKKAGSLSFEIPVGTTKIYFHAQGWGTDNTTISIESNDGNVTPTSIALTPNSEYTGNSPFTITTDPSTDFFELTTSGITETGTIITMSAPKGKRFIVWGVNVE